MGDTLQTTWKLSKCHSDPFHHGFEVLNLPETAGKIAQQSWETATSRDHGTSHKVDGSARKGEDECQRYKKPPRCYGVYTRNEVAQGWM